MAPSFEPARKYRWQHTVTGNPKSPDRFEKLRRRSAQAEAGGGPERRERFANPYVAAIIVPSQPRARLITSLRSLETKRNTNPKKKHDNILL